MKKRILRIFLLFLLAAMIVGLNHQLSLTEYRISNSRIPDSFDGYRIAVVSDLHAERFGEKQQTLIAMLRESECDLICFPGDIVSHDTTDFSPVWELLDGLGGIPMVYVAGNNELSLKNYDFFLSELGNRGVTVLDDMTEPSLPVSNGTDSILIHGYSFTDSRRLSGRLPVSEKGFYNILLYHDPYCFPEAAMLDYDLMLSGHIHGGVIRFPLIGSPLEWLNLEPFTKGLYTSRAAALIVSGGLGSHESLPRFFNAPEVVLITLDASGNR
ncbi:MAG: metallophosphoesterase [Oscillospiraceae bacterium]|nr:metallophosphoesterase [Oscillospiraceae bacterium]MBQ7130658.1 metallophosphoesterase [Oscillospiraceae bacterium]